MLIRKSEEKDTKNQLKAMLSFTGNLSEVFHKLQSFLKNVRALWRDFTGESAYERYLIRHRNECSDHEPLSEREFWRARADFDEGNTSTGCC